MIWKWGGTQLFIDLKHEFPEMGLSPRNLWDMKRFYERFSEADSKLRQLVAVLPWGHNLLLVKKVKEDQEVAFYASETLAKGCSRNLLLNAIKMDSFGQAQNQLKANNFEQTLPETHAEYANEVFRSTYNLGFLGITEPVITKPSIPSTLHRLFFESASTYHRSPGEEKWN